MPFSHFYSAVSSQVNIEKKGTLILKGLLRNLVIEGLHRGYIGFSYGGLHGLIEGYIGAIQGLYRGYIRERMIWER